MIDINPTLVAQVLNFIILVIILRAVAYKPVVRMLKERQDKIADSLKKADEDQEKAAALKAQGEAALQDAREKAQDILAAAQKRAEEEHEELVRQTKEETERMKSEAKADIERDREKAKDALRKEVVALSLAAAAKVIEKNLDEKGNARLIEEFADRLGKGELGDLSC